MAEVWDVVVVGGGHNGLVAAFYLARMGLSTLVLERRAIVGGACVTEEFAPGFRASPGAYVLAKLHKPVWQDLRLRERGLRLDAAGPSLHLYPGDQLLTLYSDRDQPVDEIRSLSPVDASAFPAHEDKLSRIASALEPVFDRPPPAVNAASVQDLIGLARFGVLIFRQGKDVQETVQLFATSAKQYLDGHFRSELLKSALGWESISNSLAAPSTPGTASNLLHEATSEGSAGGVGWGFVRGGMGVVTSLMADAAREAGTVIRAGSPVARILTKDNRATGVVLANGEEIRASRVLSNADPKRTFLTLLEESDLPASFVAAVKAYRCEGASLKINLAVAEFPLVQNGPGQGIQPYHWGLIQITKELDELDRDQTIARGGLPASRAHVEMCVPTMHDPSLAPDGKHILTIGVRSQPFRLRDDDWDVVKDAVADRVVEHIGEFMPNLAGSVLHREVLSTVDLERRLALTGGHHLHGDMLPDQLLFIRPVRGYANYRTPVSGLYSAALEHIAVAA